MKILISTLVSILLFTPPSSAATTKAQKTQTRLVHHPPDSEYYSSTTDSIGDLEGSGESPDFSPVTHTKSPNELVFKTSSSKPLASNGGNSSASDRKTSGDKRTNGKTPKTTTTTTTLATSTVEHTFPSTELDINSTSTVTTTIKSTVPPTRSPPISVRITRKPDTTTVATTTLEPAPEPEDDILTAFTIPPGHGVTTQETPSTTQPELPTTQATTTQSHTTEPRAQDRPLTTEHTEMPSSSHSSLASVCYDVYQHCLMSQTTRFGADPIGPYFVDETLLGQFCKQHEEIVQPCLAKTLQLDEWDRALEHCAGATQQDDQASSTTAYMIIRAARTWQFMCQLHKLHFRNDSFCFREKMTQCVLNMDLNFLSKCQIPCDRVIKEEPMPTNNGVHKQHDSSLLTNNSDPSINLENEELQLSPSGVLNPFMPWGAYHQKHHHGDAHTRRGDMEEDLAIDEHIEDHELWVNGVGRQCIPGGMTWFLVAACILLSKF